MCCLSVTGVLTIAVLLVTVVFLIWRLSNVNEGIAAAVGAVAVLLLGTATPADVWRGTVNTAGVLVFLLAMMVVAIIAEDAGCFDWAAGRAVALSRGNGYLLFLNLYLLGALVTVFLSLDVTAIIIAPVVCSLVQRARLSPLPFVMACAFVANTASLFLPISNLTNMLVYSLLEIPFWTFVRLLTLPNLAAMAVNLVVFFVLFRREIPARFTAPAVDRSDSDSTHLMVTGLALGGVVVGLVVFGALDLPLYVPAVLGALVLTPLALARQRLPASRLLRGVAWPLPFFVIGMYTIVVAANRVGLSQVWGGLFASSRGQQSLANLLGVAFGTAVGSNLFNNIPMSLVVITGLLPSRGPAGIAPAFASLVGTNVGSNVTVFGSLATMLVLYAARRYDIRVSAFQFLKIGLLTTPLMILASTTVLWLQLR
ncbi:MAG TPA: SLC13 family permease [Chloroflexota bacterium]|nr:SLC13 family permease [Chloroflexota bacterium]